MKLIAGITLLIALTASAVAQDKIRATMLGERVGVAIEKGDLAKLDDVLANKAAIYWIDKKFKDKASFEKYMRVQVSSFDNRAMSLSEDGGMDDDKISTSWGTFAFLNSKGNSGVGSRMMGRYTVVATEVDGKWRIIAMHFSIAFPPDLPDPIN